MKEWEWGGKDVVSFVDRPEQSSINSPEEAMEGGIYKLQ